MYWTSRLVSNEIINLIYFIFSSDLIIFFHCVFRLECIHSYYFNKWYQSKIYISCFQIPNFVYSKALINFAFCKLAYIMIFYFYSNIFFFLEFVMLLIGLILIWFLWKNLWNTCLKTILTRFLWIFLVAFVLLLRFQFFSWRLWSLSSSLWRLYSWHWNSWI